MGGGRLERLEGGPRWRLPVVVGAVALATRLLVLFDQRADNPLFTLGILDDGLYLQLAAGLTDGSDPRAWFLAPLYPWALAAASSVLGPGMLTASLVNVAAGTLAAVLAALAARDLHSQAAGWFAGGLVAFAGTFVFHDVLPGQEPLLCLLHVAGASAALRWLRGGAVLDAGWAGLASGVAAMGRATSLSIALAALALAALRLRPARRLLPGVAALVLGVLVVLLPAALRNRSVAGDLTPFPWSGGVNLYVANGPDARAETAFVARELGYSPAEMEVNARRIAEEAEGRALTPGEVSAYWSARTRADSGGAGEMLPHLVRKAALFWAASEYGSNHYVELERRYSLWLRIVPVSAWWLLALGVGGWWLVRRRVREADVLALVVLVTWGGLTLVYPVSRYRLPVVPLTAILAAAGVAELLRGEARSRRAVAGGLVVAATALAWSHGAIRPPPAAIPSYTNLGSALAYEGRDVEAEEVLREGLAEWPDDGPALVELGRVLIRQGRPEEALEHLGRAEKDARTQWAAGVPALLALVDSGQVGRAESVGAVLDRELTQASPLRAEMLAWWALAAHARGDTGTARTRLAAARRMAPGSESVATAERRLGIASEE
jgi:tetratricopeptide (TPR) repeat protein